MLAMGPLNFVHFERLPVEEVWITTCHSLPSRDHFMSRRTGLTFEEAMIQKVYPLERNDVLIF